ncbi:MAG: PEP/pyruvate-binding domain-containing protein, partial [bacterium]
MAGKSKDKQFILWFKELGIKDVPLVGGKNASLGEMYRRLTDKGINVPNGFAVTAYAYRYFLKKTKTDKEIKALLKGLDITSIADLKKRARLVRQAILKAPLPEEMIKEIKEAYGELCRLQKINRLDVAVRSSATAEDLPSASFAGQQETFLNIRGTTALIQAVRKSYASLFTDRAISYREDKGFDHFKIALSTGVQKMVRSDQAVSGVMFTLDTESGFRDLILINSIYGLGENIVKGLVNPDEFFVFKPTLKDYLNGKKINPVISRQLGTKDHRLIYSDDPKNPTKNIPVDKKDKKSFSLSQLEIIKLAEWGLMIEQHYKRPMDIEWAKDGLDNKLYIVQARPETIHAVKDPNVLERYVMAKKSKVICAGQSVGA